MMFTVLDWLAIVGYLLITVLLALYFRHSSVKSREDSFVSGRRGPTMQGWPWLTGFSQAAVTDLA